MSGLLTVELVKGDNLLAANFGGGDSDPYAILKLGAQRGRSHTIEASIHPRWKQTFNFLTDKTEHLSITIMNQNVIRADDHLGDCEVGFGHLVPWKPYRTQEKLVNVQKGSIELCLRYVPLIDLQTPAFRDRFGFDFGLVTNITEQDYQKALETSIPESWNCDPPPWRDIEFIGQTGIGIVYKPSVWEWIASSNYQISPRLLSQSCYSNLIAQQGCCSANDQIDRDVDRTFSLHYAFTFEEGRQTLARLLKALSIYIPHIGYCQGMNSIVGFIMLLASEELAFKLTAMLLESILGSSYHITGLAGVLIDQAVIDKELPVLLPELSAHFKEFEVSISLVTTEWFLTLFTGSMPFESTLRVWDMIFCYGPNVLICTAIALLRMQEPQLLILCDFEEIKDYIFKQTRLMYNHKLLTDHVRELLILRDWNKLREESVSTIHEDQKQYDWHIKKLTKLTQPQINKLRSRWQEVAVHCVVTRDTFPTLFDDPLNSLVMDKNISPRFWQQFDKSHAGIIEFKQFCVGAAPLVCGTPEEKIKFCFELMDMDDDGLISEPELELILAWQFRTLGNEFDRERLEACCNEIFFGKEPRSLTLAEFTNWAKSQPMCFLLSMTLDSQ